MPALAYRTSLPQPDDPLILERIADATRKGHAITTAGPCAGIGQTTSYEWYMRGQEDLAEAERQGLSYEELGSHAKFAKAVKDAEAEMVEAKLSIVERDMAFPGKGWLAAMTLLERRRPQDFGRRDRLEVDQRSVSVSVNLTAQLPPSALAEVLALALSEAQAEQRLLMSPSPEAE